MGWASFLGGMNSGFKEGQLHRYAMMDARDKAYLAPYKNYAEASKYVQEGMTAPSAGEMARMSNYYTMQNMPTVARADNQDAYYRGMSASTKYNALKTQLDQAQLNYRNDKLMEPYFKDRVRMNHAQDIINYYGRYANPNDFNATNSSISQHLGQYGYPSPMQGFGQADSMNQAAMLYGLHPQIAGQLHAAQTASFASSNYPLAPQPTSAPASGSPGMVTYIPRGNVNAEQAPPSAPVAPSAPGMPPSAPGMPPSAPVAPSAPGMPPSAPVAPSAPGMPPSAPGMPPSAPVAPSASALAEAFQPHGLTDGGYGGLYATTPAKVASDRARIKAADVKRRAGDKP